MNATKLQRFLLLITTCVTRISLFCSTSTSRKKLLILLLVSFAFGSVAFAQNRKSVSGAEVTGTFRSFYKGKFKSKYNEIKILALGKGKLKISYDLTDPYRDGASVLADDALRTDGTAEIVGDTAIFSPDGCKITIKFVKQGKIKVTQDGMCDFGFNVSADGTYYQKVSTEKPKFE